MLFCWKIFLYRKIINIINKEKPIDPVSDNNSKYKLCGCELQTFPIMSQTSLKFFSPTPNKGFSIYILKADSNKHK